MENEKNRLSKQQVQEVLTILKARFEKNMDRHKTLEWTEVQTKLENSHEKLWSLYEMERTDGEPDVVILEESQEDIIFVDCSVESPKGRRSLCYDREALESRKENKPTSSVMDMALEMGIEVLAEHQYRQLQRYGSFDTKTSSWLITPDSIRKLGGAIFGDRRYNTVFVYHNGAESYYAARGFRGLLKI